MDEWTALDCCSCFRFQRASLLDVVIGVGVGEETEEEKEACHGTAATQRGAPISLLIYLGGFDEGIVVRNSR